MQLVDRIEKRRFVGREFLLWLWFESEVFEGTLRTEEHGEFGLWIERQTVLSQGAEVTRIKGASPTGAREAKEALLRGKLPESAGVRVSRDGSETAFVFKAESMALAGLALPTVLDVDDEPAPLAPPGPPPRRRKGGGAQDRVSDEEHETFYERMRLAREVEEIVEALYQDFLAMRLAPVWDAVVVPAMRAWAQGGAIDEEAYRAATPRAPKRKRSRTRA